MSRGTLRKIQKFDGPTVPDPKWKRVGTTPWGQQLYHETQRRARAVPVYDDDGNRVFTKSPSGVELVPKNKPEFFEYERLFYLVSEGNGNVRRQLYSPPTAEEIAEAERTGKIAEMKDSLAAAFVDAGMTPEKMIEAFLRRPIEPNAEDVNAPVAPAAPAVEGDLDDDGDVTSPTYDPDWHGDS
jgi:hypothetical protein